jgi:glycerol-3-phosphate O-acyltransferase/dihydroxyacetone phosphate acyltransferase
MAAYEEQFLSQAAGDPRAAVKRLTQRIESDLTRFTVNAPDWCGSLTHFAIAWED